jgi:hypothetical protein
MVKLVVKQPGFFVTVPNMGSFRSPFKVKIPESLVPLVEMELLKSGVKDFKVSPTKEVKEKPRKVQEVKVNSDMSEVMKKLEDIQTIVQKILLKDPSIINIVQHTEEEIKSVKKAEEAEEEMFIPSLSDKNPAIELSVKTSEKDDVSSRVESLSNLRKRRR